MVYRIPNDHLRFVKKQQQQQQQQQHLAIQKQLC